MDTLLVTHVFLGFVIKVLLLILGTFSFLVGFIGIWFVDLREGTEKSYLRAIGFLLIGMFFIAVLAYAR